MRRTSTIALAFLGLFISTAVWAAVPHTLHYSGKLDTAGGAFSGTIDVGFALYEDASATTSFWTDSQAVTVTNGRFHVALGPLSAADVDVAALQLGVTVGTDDEMDKVAIASVPYALRADEAGNAATVGGQAVTDFAAVVHSHALADLDIADGLNFSEFKDTMTLDASTTVQIPPSDSFTFQAGTQSTGIFYGSGDVMLGLSGSSGNVSVGATPTASFKFSVSGNTRLFGDSYLSGNVGIGTAASPEHKLYIAGASYHAGGAEFDGGVGVGTMPTSSYKLTVDGDALFYGGSVGIGGTPDSKYQLRVVGDTSVTGTLDATAFVGDGSGLTNVATSESDPEVAMNTLDSVPRWDGAQLDDSALTVTSAGSVVSSGTYDYYADIGSVGPGSRLAWYPEKAAFRAGALADVLSTPTVDEGLAWDNPNVGSYSVATGYSTSASGVASTAMGYATTASEQYSTAMGYATTASAQYSTAIGNSTTASAQSSTAMGNGTEASGKDSTAMGQSTTASGEKSTAMGHDTEASGHASTAMGYNTTASAYFSTAIGYGAQANGDYSTAIGNVTQANAPSSMAMGHSIRVGPGADHSIGIGLAALTVAQTVSKPNIMAIMNGKVGIGSVDPGSYHLYVTGHAFTTGTWQGSDRRWKKNIVPFSNALGLVERLRGVRFDWRDDEFPDQHLSHGSDVGFIAQEVEAVLPALVKGGPNGFKAVSYAKLVAVLVEAVKELATQIHMGSASDDVAALQAENAQLKVRLARIEERLGRVEATTVAHASR